MAKAKLKLMYLAQIFREYTDKDHGLTIHQLIDKLNQYDIAADRKTIYADLEDLRSFGLDIRQKQDGRSILYYLGSREFKAAELKMLVDLVQASRFIPAKKARALIKKLEALGSKYHAEQFRRQIFLVGRTEQDREDIYDTVDTIHRAIHEGRQISFRYFHWTVSKKQVSHRGDELYRTSPWALVWNNENYYLVAFDEEDKKPRHYRVDKMSHLRLVNKQRRGKEYFEENNLKEYCDRLFGMYGAEPVTVTLHCRDELAGAIIDRFGQGVMMIPMEEGYFQVQVPATDSKQFLGWVVGLGDGIKITAPESLVQDMRNLAQKLAERYS